MTSIDSNLIRRARRGDRSAIEFLLYEIGLQCEPRIKQKIPSRYQAVLSAEDVIQIARMQAFPKLSNLESDHPAAFSSWFYEIARNALRTEMRKLATKKRGGDVALLAEKDGNGIDLDEFPGRDETPSTNARRDEIAVAVKENLAKLPSTQRKAMQLSAEGCTINETAHQLNKKRSAIGSLLARTRKILRAALGNSWHD